MKMKLRISFLIVIALILAISCQNALLDTNNDTNNALQTRASTGSITYQKWDGISGTSVSDLTGNSNYPDNPSSTTTRTSMEAPSNIGDSYGARLIGTFHPPETGNYYFWIAADDNCELWLASNKIAGHTDWTSSRQWNKFSSQKSAAKWLDSSNTYSIMAIMKEGGGGDNMAVGWRKPSNGNGSSPVGVIPGSVLSEYSGGGSTNSINSVNVSMTVTAGSSYSVSVDYESTGTHDIAMRIEDTTDNWRSYGEFRQTVNSGSGTVNGTLNIASNAPAHSNYQIQTIITEQGGWWNEKFDNLTTAGVTVSSGGGGGGGTGKITYQKWNSISGTSVSALTGNSNYPDNPSSTTTRTSMEAATNIGDNYGARLIGTFHPPETGNYYFWIAADDNCELWLASNKIAGHTGWTSSRQWNKYTSQKSAAKWLNSSNTYSIMAIMKEGGGGDNMAVGWRKPSNGNGSSPVGVIPGSVLSEYDGGIIDPPPTGGDASMMINLNGVTYYGTDFIFTDYMKQADGWRASSGTISVDSNGWVTSLSAGQTATSYVIWDNNGRHPGGDYKIMWDGKGTFKLNGSDGSPTINSTGSGTYYYSINSGDNSALSITISSTNTSDYLRNIRVIPPGYHSKYSSQTLTDEYMNKWDDFTGYRFMDWGSTNNNEARYWSKRRLPSYRSYNDAFDQTDSDKNDGVPYEVMIELCNETNRDGWFCIPHKADDNYVRNLARLLRDNMETGRKIYIEYSNETWNGMFDQTNYCLDRGKNIWPDEPDFKAQLFYSGYRSDQVFDIFNAEFSGQTDRIICVAAAQSSNSWTGQQVLSKCASTVEAFAIAPYFGGSLGNPNGSPDPDAVEHWSVSYTIDKLRNDANINSSIPKTMTEVQENKATADSYGIQLIAYEGGQHLVGVGSWVNDTQLNTLFDAVNRNWEMESLYEYYFDQWKANGGGVFAAFASTSRYSKYGRWGVDEYYNQPLSDAPKLKGILDWIANN